MQKYTFSEPFEFDGETYTEIEFDLKTLKGVDISATKKIFSQEVPICLSLGADTDFCALLLARMTKKPIEFYKEMPAKDYCELTQTVSNFLTF